MNGLPNGGRPIRWVKSHNPSEPIAWLIPTITWIVGATACGVASFYVIERPALNFRDKMFPSRTSLPVTDQEVENEAKELSEREIDRSPAREVP